MMYSGRVLRLYVSWRSVAGTIACVLPLVVSVCGCQTRKTTPARTLPSSASSVAKPIAPSRAQPPATSATRADPTSVRTMRETAQVALDDGEAAALRKRFPRALLQSAVLAPTRRGSATLALVWNGKPATENRCPRDIAWNAYDMQSCTGFHGALAGSAVLVRFEGASLVEVFALDQFFQHDANPSGVEIKERRGARMAFIQPDYRLALYDLNGDGRASEVLLHVSNGPYALLRHFAAIGLLRDKLETPRTSAGDLVAVDLDAWQSLERTGRGTSQLYCGARCSNAAIRWVVERNSLGLIDEKSFWTCTPDLEASWKMGKHDGSCDP